jgi:hypothetical protein
MRCGESGAITESVAVNKEERLPLDRFHALSPMNQCIMARVGCQRDIVEPAWRAAGQKK